MSNFFCEKIAKNVKTGFILANFSFFVKFFAERSRKMSNSREKLPKMVESDLILAKCAFFVNVSPFVGQVRRILPCLKSGSQTTVTGARGHSRGTGPRATDNLANRDNPVNPDSDERNGAGLSLALRFAWGFLPVF